MIPIGCGVCSAAPAASEEIRMGARISDMGLMAELSTHYEDEYVEPVSGSFQGSCRLEG